jgi:endonuclease G
LKEGISAQAVFIFIGRAYKSGFIVYICTKNKLFMSHKKRTATKKDSGKQHKRRLNAGVFFAMVIGVLLVVAVYYIYRYEQENSKPAMVFEASAGVETAEPGSQEKPNDAKAQRKPEAQAATLPSVPSITEYTDLEYPVSHSSQPEQIIFHTGYAVSYNKTWKIPNWVSYELTIDETMGEEERSDKFIPDPLAKEGVVTTADYRNSGYDRGHMAPAADMKWSNAAMKESFYLSNICPQHPNLNRSRWKELENNVRKWAVADSAVIVICGPVVNDSPQRIGNNSVVVPHGFFKVILSPHKEQPETIGFLFSNERCILPLHAYVVSVDSVETVTGLDFFSPLPDETEDLLEARVDTAYWGLSTH